MGVNELKRCLSLLSYSLQVLKKADTEESKKYVAEVEAA